MARRVFTNEYKRQILEQLLPPNNKTVPEIAASENIPKTTIYNWVAKARKDGQVIPNNSNPSNDGKWNELDKLRIVIEASCRLIGQYQFTRLNQKPGNGNPLLFPAGTLVYLLVLKSLESYLFQGIFN